MSFPSRILAGAMSGTSADGVDIALVEISGRGLAMSAKLLHHHARPYDAALRQRIFGVRNAGHVSLAELGQLGREISLAYAAAVNDALREANLRAVDLAAVAAHGQTLYHDPPNTIQWFDPALVAAEVGCPVVSDFRRADCAAGGQGAPLVPFADYVLFRHPTKNRVLVNIGGIANITCLPAGASSPDSVIAFDTGPGNCISDHVVRTRRPASGGVDHNGDLAALGTRCPDVVNCVRDHPYFRMAHPKSTDTPAMIRIFEDACAGREAELSLEDLLATACALTVETLIDGAFFSFRPVPDEFIVSGGGTRNRTMMNMLRTTLGGIGCITSDELGVPSDSKEAIAFALLGAATLDGIPSNVPSATGAKRAVVLGSVTPKP